MVMCKTVAATVVLAAAGCEMGGPPRQYGVGTTL